MTLSRHVSKKRAEATRSVVNTKLNVVYRVGGGRGRAMEPRRVVSVRRAVNTGGEVPQPCPTPWHSRCHPTAQAGVTVRGLRNGYVTRPSLHPLHHRKTIRYLTLTHFWVDLMRIKVTVIIIVFETFQSHLKKFPFEN